MQRSRNHYTYYRRIIKQTVKQIERMKLTIWVLSSALVFSTIVNLFFGYQIRWLKEPRDTFILKNKELDSQIEYVRDLKFNIQMEFLNYRVQKSFLDTFQIRIEKREDYNTVNPLDINNLTYKDDNEH